MFREHCEVLKNERVTPGHYALKLKNPRIAKAALPGQFVQVMCSDSSEPLLPRPFSFLTADAQTLSLLYQVVGKGTEILSRVKEGGKLWVTGPLGNGFSLSAGRHSAAALVGGGVGIPPLYHLAQTLLKSKIFSRQNIHVFLGARNRSLLLCEKDFKKLGVHLEVATDDGSKGQKGYVTSILENFLKNAAAVRVYACGPTPMLRAVSKVSAHHKTSCEVSVEVPMACGFGACIGCAIKVKHEAAHRYAIACCEGPVFKSTEIIWE